MPTDIAAHRSGPAEVHDAIAQQLADQGWCVTPDFITPELASQLAVEARDGWQSGGFRRAGVGHGDELQLRPEIRSDRVKWIDPAVPTAAQQAYLNQLEQLRLAINGRLYMGLFDFEGHLAVYPPGSFYKRHLDRFREVSRRTVSTVLYLNDDWHADDGGQLRIYTDPDEPQRYLDVLPIGGRLVTFLSAEFEHEVRPAQRDRLSLTGWFRTRDPGQR